MTSSKTTVVGIDLGTTYSLVSVLQNGQARVLPNALDEILTPSAVSVDADGTVYVGAAARARATTHPESTALAFKRDMGTDRVFKLAGKEFSPQDLSALVLRELKRDAEHALGYEIEEAVITVPAYFGEAQRQATRDAGAIAGLRVDRIINEPTAAALAYGLHSRNREMRCVVLDLGGGTFDVTVLEIIEGVIEIQASSGDAHLGGEDFVDALAALVVKRTKESKQISLDKNPVCIARVREACENAKKRLTDSEETRVVASGLVAGDTTFDLDFPITRADAEEVWIPLLDRLKSPITRALRDAKVEVSQIDEVLLVGGSTRMPCISRLATQIFGRLPLRTLPADEAVALGAAVQAALKSNDAAVEDMVVTDVAPFSMGVASATIVGGHVLDGIYDPILERGTVIPASRSKTFNTLSNNQTVILLKIYQGEHAEVKNNQKLGEYKISNLPPAPAGQTMIDVRFTYDLNGLLEVETTVMGTNRKETLVIEKTPGRLTKEEIEKARAAMKTIKFHPRDALPNVTALARADALYAELSGSAREILGQRLLAFRAALEMQDHDAIAHTRAELVQLTATLKRV